MTDEVTVMFDDDAWHDVLKTQPLQIGIAVLAGIWDQVARAPLITQEKPTPGAIRVATLTRAQALSLERWLEEVASRPDSPPGARAALAAVREGIRLAR